MNAKDAAKQILARFERTNKSLTHLPLQKLLYYAKAWSMAIDGSPIFQNDVQAWQHGPVVPSVYPKYNKFGSGPIQLDEHITLEESDLFDAIVEAYKEYADGYDLAKLTHGELPWMNHYVEGEMNVIPDEEIEAFFRGDAREIEEHRRFLDVYGDLRLGAVEPPDNFESEFSDQDARVVAAKIAQA